MIPDRKFTNVFVKSQDDAVFPVRLPDYFDIRNPQRFGPDPGNIRPGSWLIRIGY